MKEKCSTGFIEPKDAKSQRLPISISRNKHFTQQCFLPNFALPPPPLLSLCKNINEQYTFSPLVYLHSLYASPEHNISSSPYLRALQSYNLQNNINILCHQILNITQERSEYHNSQALMAQQFSLQNTLDYVYSYQFSVPPPQVVTLSSTIYQNGKTPCTLASQENLLGTLNQAQIFLNIKT